MPRSLRVLPFLLALLPTLCFLPARAQAVDDDPVPVGTWPLQPQPAVVERFDPPTNPFGAGHRGVDLAGTVGQRVHAALPGTVMFAGRIAGKGVVTVRHRDAAGDTRTTYEPVAVTVSVGDHVAAGDVLGRLELPFGHCLPSACLHWGWLRGEVYLDPLLLVGGAGRIRLLPPSGAEPVAVDDSGSTAGWPGSIAQARGCACW